VGANAETVDEGLAAGDVAPCCTKRLGEGAHQDVDEMRVHAEIICDTSSMGTDSTDGMCLVNEKVKLDFLKFQQKGNVRNEEKKRTLYFLFNSRMPGRLTNVPSILYNPSTMTRIFFQGRCVLGCP